MTITAPMRLSRTRRPGPRPFEAPRWLGILLVLLGVGVGTAAILGPLVTGAIRFHVVDDVLDQVRGGDLVGLVLVAPTAIAAGILVMRRRSLGLVMALAPSAYGAYTYAQLALGGEFAAEPGNSELFFPLFLALFVSAGACLIGSWGALGRVDLPPPSGRVRRTVIGVTFLLAAFLAFGLHLPGLFDVLGGEPFEVEYTQGPTVFWIVKLMDLGLVVPIAVLTGAGLLRRSDWAIRAMYAVIGWGALLGSAVAGMALMMQINGDPGASSVNTAAFAVFALAFIALAMWLLRPVARLDRREG